MNDTAEPTGARLLTVGDEAADRRLDNFLLNELKGVPRTRIYRMIRKGEVRVNKGRARPAYRLVSGDCVRLPPVHGLRQSGAHTLPTDKVQWILERVLYEDDSLLVLDKPSGLAVHGGSGIRLGAIELLRAARPDCRSLELVHRLDRDTSGCLLVAKKRSSLRQLHAQFRGAGVRKHYQALLAGEWSGGARKVDLPLQVEHRQSGERHVRVGPGGKEALTWFRPLERFKGWVLCEAELHTGRTHQIRVHAAAIGHPVAGDPRYAADKPVPVGLKRLFLHACRLQLTHPVTSEPLQFQSPLDKELQRVLTALRQPA